MSDPDATNPDTGGPDDGGESAEGSGATDDGSGSTDRSGATQADGLDADLTVLLVDPDETALEQVSTHFERAYPRVEVATETDGLAAYEFVRSRTVECLVVEHEVPDIEWDWLAKAVACPVVLYTDSDPSTVGDDVLAATDTFVQKRTVEESRWFLARKVVGVTTQEQETDAVGGADAAAVAQRFGGAPGVFLLDADGTVQWRSRAFDDLFPVGELDVSLPETADLDARLGALFGNDPETIRDVLGRNEDETSDWRVFGIPVGAPTHFFRHRSYPVDEVGGVDGGGIDADVTRVAVFEPITGAVDAAERLDLLERLTQNAQDGLYVIDADAEFVYCNRTFAGMFGYEPGDLVGQHCSMVLAPGELERGQEVVDRLWQSDAESEVIDQEFVTRDGERVHGAVHFSIRTVDGEYAGLMGVVRELSAGTRALRDVDRYRSIVHASPIPTCVVDESGTIEVANDPLADLLGPERRALVGRDVRQVLPARAAEDGDDVARRIRTATEVGADRFPLRLETAKADETSGIGESDDIAETDGSPEIDETDRSETTERQAGDADAREFTVEVASLGEEGGFDGSLLTFLEGEKVRHT